MAEELRIVISDGGGNLGSPSQGRAAGSAGAGAATPSFSTPVAMPGSGAGKSDLLSALGHVGKNVGLGGPVAMLEQVRGLSSSFQKIFNSFAARMSDKAEAKTANNTIPAADHSPTTASHEGQLTQLARKSASHLEHIEALMRNTTKSASVVGTPARPSWFQRSWKSADDEQATKAANVMPLGGAANGLKAAQGAAGAAGAGQAAGAGSAAGIGGAAALTPITLGAAAVVTAFTAVAAATYRLERHFSSMAEEFSELNPQLALGEASREIRTMFRDMQRAQDFGPELDRLRDAEFRLSNSVTKLSDAIKKPLLTPVVTLLDKLASMMESVTAKAGDKMDKVLEKIEGILKWIPLGFAAEADILRAVVAIKRAMKDDPDVMSTKLLDDLIANEPDKRQIRPQSPRNAGFRAGRAT